MAFESAKGNHLSMDLSSFSCQAKSNIQHRVQGSHGPLSTSSAGLELFMSSYLSFEPWVIDSSLVPLAWRSIILPRKLKVAVMWNDGIVKPHPPILRALQQVVAALEGLKDEFCVVEWQAWNHAECWRLIQSLYYEDGGAALREAFKRGGEEALPLTNWLLESDNVKAYSPNELNKVSHFLQVLSI